MSVVGQSPITAPLFPCVNKGGLSAGRLTFGNVTTNVMSLPRELPEIVYQNNEGHKVGIITAVYEIKDFFFGTGALEKSVIESELKGAFTDLQKALFIVDEKDSSVLASVLYRISNHF